MYRIYQTGLFILIVALSIFGQVGQAPGVTGGSGSGLPTLPTTPNGVPQVVFCTPSGGVCTAAFGMEGVPTNAQTGTTYTVAATDRSTYISFSNAGAIAVTLPQAGTTGFLNNFVFVGCDIGAGTATITPTTSTISSSNGSAYTSAAATLALTTGQCAWVYSDNANYFAIVRGGGGSGIANAPAGFTEAATGMSGTGYGSLNGTGSFDSGTELNAQSVAPRAATYANLRVAMDINLPASGSLAVTFRSCTPSGSPSACAGADSTLTCTVAVGANTCTDLTHSLAVAAGDFVSIKFVGGASIGTVRPSVAYTVQ